MVPIDRSYTQCSLAKFYLIHLCNHPPPLRSHTTVSFDVLHTFIAVLSTDIAQKFRGYGRLPPVPPSNLVFRFLCNVCGMWKKNGDGQKSRSNTILFSLPMPFFEPGEEAVGSLWPTGLMRRATLKNFYDSDRFFL